SVLGRSAFVQRRRTTGDLSWRTKLSAHPAKCAPLFSVSRDPFHRHFDLRCLARALVFGSCDRANELRRGIRHNHPRGECAPPGKLHFRLPFTATPGRWISRSTLESASLLQRVSLRKLSEPASHALGVAQSNDRDVRGRLCSP